MAMRERDPMHWAFPLPWRPMGVTVKIHILFPCVVLGLILWVATSKQFADKLWPHACLACLILFISVLLHELGHVWGARRMDGDAMEVLLWPLGGLAYVDVPHTPRAHAWATLFGPLVNFFIALAVGIALVASGFIPPLNPLASPLNPRMDNWREGVKYFSKANPGELEYWRYQDLDTHKFQEVQILFETLQLAETPHTVAKEVKPEDVELPAAGERHTVLKKNKAVRVEPSQLGKGQWLLAQIFTINWFLFLINLLPAFPLDGGRLLQCFFWRRTDYRHGTAMAAYVGFLMMLLVGIYAIAVNDILPAALAFVIYIQCRQQLFMLEHSEEPSGTGYDFSQGYTSLEKEEAPPPPPPKPSAFQRWLQQRTERRRQREQEQRLAEERRMDELLDKIHREGKQALTDEELRFLTRMATRYPNRSRE